MLRLNGLVRYYYLTKDLRKVGWYQCDVADFRQLWRVIRHDVSCCIIEFNSGEKFLFHRKNKQWIWEKR